MCAGCSWCEVQGPKHVGQDWKCKLALELRGAGARHSNASSWVTLLAVVN